MLRQQGRVALDADDNERDSIVLYYLRTLARDLIGPYAAPANDAGFDLTYDADGLHISAGRYYVDGILVENEEDCLYATQADYPVAEDDPLIKAGKDQRGDLFFVYLVVWERHITTIEDDYIREKALGGPDTCTRAKVVWQVRSLDLASQALNNEAAKQKLLNDRAALSASLDVATDATVQKDLEDKIAAIDAELAKLKSLDGPAHPPCDVLVGDLVTLSSAMLAARVAPDQQTQSACVTPPGSKYRGVENHLYRVEIHDGGTVGEATFKWSRDNGSIVAAWAGTEGNDLLASSGRGFEAGNWVELSDDAAELLGGHGSLVRVGSVEGDALTVDQDSLPSADALAWSDQLVNPKIRRWDQTQNDNVTLTDGVVPVKEGVWLDLEDGLQVQFSAGGEYRTGDYWLIPARVATGEVEWPTSVDDDGKVTQIPMSPDGIEYHYAPLGVVSWMDNQFAFESCRCQFYPLGDCFGLRGAKPELKGTAVRANRSNVRKASKRRVTKPGR